MAHRSAPLKKLKCYQNKNTLDFILERTKIFLTGANFQE